MLTWWLTTEGPVSGEIIDFHGVQTYVSGDKASKKIIFILTDIFGHILTNVQLVADDFAAQGYYVIVPDLFNGDPIPWTPFDKLGEVDLPTWLGKHSLEVTEPIVDKVYNHIKEDFAPTSIGAIGYCFGAKYTVRLLGAGKIQAGAIAHPSFVDDAEVEQIKLPFHISAAETDPIFPRENRFKTEEILQKNAAPYQITVYSHVVHGFAVRVDPSIPLHKYAKEQAFISQAAFFNFHL
ncbi:dienelactone hydrolase, partial [Lipomyces japonicus]|uniref:dienelactone hydrolase n=1 Tax=Lipomyces japonicus TaxID=56871 RepID=UPI0034CE56D1